MAETILIRPNTGERLQRYVRLTKPRVVSLIVFCAVIGMLLATPAWCPCKPCWPRQPASPWWPAPPPP
jgi:protoheme IX farnesyltransferase